MRRDELSARLELLCAARQHWQALAARRVTRQQWDPLRAWEILNVLVTARRLISSKQNGSAISILLEIILEAHNCIFIDLRTRFLN